MLREPVTIGPSTSYVMTVFEADLARGRPRPDSTELLELRFVSEREARDLQQAAWVPEVLEAVFHRGMVPGFRRPTWRPG